MGAPCWAYLTSPRRAKTRSDLQPRCGLRSGLPFSFPRSAGLSSRSLDFRIRTSFAFTQTASWLSSVGGRRQKSFRAHRNIPYSSRTFVSNFAKIRSHFALSLHSRHEPHVQRRYGFSGGSGPAKTASRDGDRGPRAVFGAFRGSGTARAAARNKRYALDLDGMFNTSKSLARPVPRMNATPANAVRKRKGRNVERRAPGRKSHTAPGLRRGKVPVVRREVQYRDSE
jgi:hypothetical protein